MQLVDGEREDVVVMGENCGGAVAVVHIGVYYHRSFNRVVELQATDGDGHVVKHAESFAVIGAGVVETAADVCGAAVYQSALTCKNRAAGCKPDSFDQFF